MELNQAPAARIPLELDVEFRKSYAREATAGTLKNISLTGAFVEHGQLEVQVGDRLQVVLNVAGRIRKIQAQVIWGNGLGCGIKFLPVNNRDVQIVDDLMYFVENKRMGHRGVFDSILKKVS